VNSKKGGGGIDPAHHWESMMLPAFIATPNAITNSLRLQLSLLQRAGHQYTKVMAAIVNECYELYHGGYYILPEDKHQLL
jgi:hypothetical protein